MRSYRKHLSGEAAFKSFVPTPLSEIQVIHTEELDKLIMETESVLVLCRMRIVRWKKIRTIC